MDGLMLTAILLVISGILYKLFATEHVKGKAIPGPKGYPFVGSGLELTLDNIYEKFFEFAEKHGEIFQIQIFHSKAVVLNSQELIHKAFCSEKYKQYFNNRGWFFWGEHFFEKDQTITFIVDPTEAGFGEMRKNLARALHMYGEGIPRFEEKVTSEIQRLVGKIEETNGEEFDFVALIRESLSSLISILIIGKHADKEDIDAFWELVWAQDFFLSAITNSVLSTFPFLVHIPGYYKRRYDRCLNAKQKVIEKYFRNMKATRKAGVTRGIVDWYLDQQHKELDEGRKPFMTDTRIINLILEIMNAGIITTWSVFSSVMLCLLNHTSYQKKLQEELDQIPSPLSMSDRHSCPLTEAVLYESQRLLTPSPFLGQHECSEDVNFEGFHIKKGTPIIPNGWYVHHNEKVWGDPWVFRPERFLDDSGEIVPNTHLYRKSWIPFGTGKRQCPGESLARSRLFLYLGTLLKTFTFLPSESGCGTCDPRKGEFDRNILLRPKPFKCRVIKRGTNINKEQ